MPKLIRLSVDKYLNLLASGRPTPGGGSASALVASLGVGLLLMVSEVVTKRLKSREAKRLEKTTRFLKKALKDSRQIVDLDVQVYQTLMKTYGEVKRLDKIFGQKKLESALTNSFRLQADLAFLTFMAKQTLPVIGALAKGSIASDLTVASGFLDGAFRGAIQTAKINLAYMKSEKKDHFKNGIRELEKKYYAVKLKG